MGDDSRKTAGDLVPDADDRFVDYVLWEETPFPMGTEDEIREALTSFVSEPGRVEQVRELLTSPR